MSFGDKLSSVSPPLLALIGYRATGKTTVGKLLATRLGVECVDTDAEIVRRSGLSIAEIFASHGESGFRDLEAQVVDEMTRRTGAILSFGGGAVLRADNRQHITSRCAPVVWLTASPQSIAKRISSDVNSVQQRPNLTSQGGMEEIQLLLDQRRPLYESCASMILDTEEYSPQELVDLIAERAIR